MIRALRLCSTPYQEGSNSAVLKSLIAQHSHLDQLLRRHLSNSIASTFAEGVLTADGQTLEWYSDLSGQPIPLAAATPSVRHRAEEILAQRLAAVRSLADRLHGGGAKEDAALLRRVAVDPDVGSIWLVEGHPVVTNWGVAGKTPYRAPVSLPHIQNTGKNTRRSALWWGLSGGLVSVLLVLSVLWWGGFLPLSLFPAPPPVVPPVTVAGPQPPPVNDLEPLRERVARLEKDLSQRLAQCVVSAPPALTENPKPSVEDKVFVPPKPTPPLPKPEPRPPQIKKPEVKPKAPAKPKAPKAEPAVPALPETGCRGQKMRVSAGPIWSDGHAQKRCPEIAREWAQKNPGQTARWTGDWVTTQWGKESVCEICITPR